MYVRITFKDGNTRQFDDSTVEYEGYVVTVIDEWGGKLSFPIDKVDSIEQPPPPRSHW